MPRGRIYDRPDANLWMALIRPGRIDADNLSIVGWLAVSPAQQRVLRAMQGPRRRGEVREPLLLLSLLDDAGRGAPAIVPPTPEELARPRWSDDGRHHVFDG